MNPLLVSPFRFLALVAAGLALGLTPRADEAPPPPDKPFVLFMGANIDVQVKRQMQRVRDYTGESFVVDVAGRPVLVPMNRDPVSIKVTPELKLSDRTAFVAALRIERAYTPQNDPHRKFAAAQSAGAAQSMVGTAAGTMANAMLGSQLAGQRASSLGGPVGPVSTGDASAQVSAYNNAVMASGADLNNSAQVAAQLEAELARQQFDAALVTCEVSAARPLAAPYLVVIAHYRLKDEPGATSSWVFAHALERVDETPRKVRILQGGFPAGYELVRSEVHLYEGGRELGTNVAERNVWLSREEAHQYLVLEHLSANKGATLPATVALGLAADELRGRVDEAGWARALHVKVSREGLPLGVYRDADLIQPAGAALEELVALVRFNPALKNGKPVDSVAHLKIADLVRGD